MTEAKTDHRAVVDGKLVYTSVTAINKHADCARKWWFKYVKGIPDPIGAAGEIGIAGHGRFETYLKTGTNILGDLERVALEMGLVPDPKTPGLLVEAKVDGVLDAAGVPFKGGLDVAWPDAENGGRVFHVRDWKWKGNPQRYINDQLAKGYKTEGEWKGYKTEGEWLADPDHPDGRQIIAYAEDIRRKFFPQFVAGDHVMLQYKGAKRAYLVSAPVMSAATIQEKWAYISDKYVEPLKLTAQVTDVKDIPEPADTKKTCFAYFKECVYASQCPRSNTAQSYYERLWGDSTTSTKPPAEGDTGMSLLDTLDDLTTAPPPPPPPPPSAPAVTETPAKEETEVQSSPEIETDAFGVGANADEAAEALMDRQPKRRGRKLGSKNKSKEAETLTVGPVEAPSVATFTPPPATTTSTAPTTELTMSAAAEELLGIYEDTYRSLEAKKVHLYFVGSPIGVETTTLSAYVEGLNKMALEGAGEKVPDVRLSDHKGLAYSRYKAVLAQLARQNPPPGGHYLVRSGGDDRIDAVAEAIIPTASLVVR